MARKQDENLIPNSQRSPSEVRENSAKGGRRSGEVRRQKKTIADYLRKWADSEVNDPKNIRALQALGMDEEATNRTLLVLPLLQKANKGDIKALQMIIELLGEDTKREAEVKRLYADIERLKAEVEMLRSNKGEGKDIEDLTPLAQLLTADEGEDEE